MKMKKSIPIILLVAIVFTFSGCKDNDNLGSGLNTPNKINMYVDGKQKQITKSGDKYDQTLFDRINVLVNIKIPKELSLVKSEISENDIKEVKGYAVEFVYDKPQAVTINNGNEVQVKFTKIIFSLSKKWGNIAFIQTKDNSYIPIGLNENLDYLVKSSVK
ncbi:hypothetical protein G9F71_025865 [Clostridium sp. FP2]|uniref:hypothetical protein n=1 Tax=Clostridium sp. FP2 TaxID=2724481 RepID=UPI0013E91C24|nr:hypothetical protein [Clostridium sp. FP2]MBZ9626235.1 hypothetical protein [Clostridium sp. FP2]